MSKRKSPRRGSLQFWPRKRAKKTRIRNWHGTGNKVLGFAGYKVGMSHVDLNDKFNPVTIIECPPLKVFGIRYLKDQKVEADVYANNLDKNFLKKIGKGSEEPKEFDDVKLLVSTQPKLMGISKKKPDIFEVGIGGNKDEKIKLGKNLIGKEIRAGDVFQKGHYVDIHSITKGKGFQGTVKRYGVAIRQHKSEKTKRGIGNLGAWTPKRVSYTVAQPGKMGFHLRTEYNKLIIDINNEDINPIAGFPNYGLIKNDYLIIKGSVGGSRKRLIIFSETSRNSKKPIEVNVGYIGIKK